MAIQLTIERPGDLYTEEVGAKWRTVAVTYDGKRAIWGYEGRWADEKRDILDRIAATYVKYSGSPRLIGQFPEFTLEFTK